MTKQHDGLPTFLVEALSALPTVAGLDRALRIEALCAEHPAFAQHLRVVAAELLEFGVAGPPASMAGDYRLGEVIGEGGMGQVFLAEQVGGLRRHVALKLMHPRHDAPELVARFERERELLARMQHDGITKVFDCGATRDGRPWFAMELVRGVPLDRYCQQRRLSLNARIGLLARICDAVWHAHQRSVVHRDLKPANILVGDDGHGYQVKIIDFGLAKALADGAIADGPRTEGGFGTPEYMAPEQAVASADVDTRADVYSLGVIAYELLTGELPLPSAALRRSTRERAHTLQTIEPERPSVRLATSTRRAEVAAERGMTATALERALRRDLDWLVARAMAKDREERYPSVAALGAELRRFLANEPLLAGPPTTFYRLRKFVRRHRAGVAVVTGFLLIAGSIVVREVAHSVVLAETVEHLELASLDDRCRDLMVAADALVPAWPARLAEMDAWLATARGMRRQVGRLEAARDDLRRKALPWTAKDAEADRATHPQLAQHEWATAWLAAWQRAESVRAGVSVVPDVELPPGSAALAPHELDTKAWDRVAVVAGERIRAGEEALGLAYARAAVAAAGGTAAEGTCTATLAHALFAVGLVAESDQAVATARSLAGGDKEVETVLNELAGVRNDLPGVIAQARAEVARLTAVVTSRRTFRFTEAVDQHLHSTMVAALDALADLEEIIERTQDRRDWAARSHDLTVASPDARRRWEAARAAIARADGMVASRSCSGVAIDLSDENVVGLVPIGKNPRTGLWEFYDLRSAWDGVCDPSTLQIPTHADDGSIQVGADTGVVFVLVPGGEFWMGSQSGDPQAPCFDPDAEHDEVPVRVRLAPFWIARHEMTRSQWGRLWDGKPELATPSWKKVGEVLDGDPKGVGWTHPVESVTLAMCDVLARTHGMMVPTEAQWEFACRAGSTSPWSTGRDAVSLHGSANVHDATAASKSGHHGDAAAWSDGFINPAPVGVFRPNAFGLFDMHGNLWELCRDPYSSECVPCRDGDGARILTANGQIVGRGGSYQDPPAAARCASRSSTLAGSTGNNVGFRPVRPVQR